MIAELGREQPAVLCAEAGAQRYPTTPFPHLCTPICVHPSPHPSQLKRTSRWAPEEPIIALCIDCVRRPDLAEYRVLTLLREMGCYGAASARRRLGFTASGAYAPLARLSAIGCRLSAIGLRSWTLPSTARLGPARPCLRVVRVFSLDFRRATLQLRPTGLCLGGFCAQLCSPTTTWPLTAPSPSDTGLFFGG